MKGLLMNVTEMSRLLHQIFRYLQYEETFSSFLKISNHHKKF